MNHTLRLLSFIGSPFVKETLKINEKDISDLNQLSIKNRVHFIFLDTLRRKKSLGKLSTIHKQEMKKCSEDLKTISQVSNILANSGIQHAIFKTIRPYPFTTVDIDVLVFGDVSYFLKATKSLQSAGYKLIAKGPASYTLKDPKANLGVDVYKEIATSYIIYMDKQKLTDFITLLELENYGCIKTLTPEADLACIIAHSIIKEQIYTLSEYFSFICYLKELNLQTFLKIIKQNNILSAVRTHTTITALLHKTAHRTVPSKLQELLSRLGEDKFESTRIIQKNFITPHKYHPITLAKSLLEITKGKKSRQSIATQLFYMLNPNISKDFANKLVNHILRETY